MESSRRDFLKWMGTASGGLLFGFSIPSLGGDFSAPLHLFSTKLKQNDQWFANAWIHVSADNSVRFIIDRSEMGQGVVTGLSQLLAEELEVDPATIQIEFAPADSRYKNKEIFTQATGGSNSISEAWNRLRHAGAMAREVFLEAAAQKWNVNKSICYARAGYIHLKDNSQKASYGALIAEAKNIRPRKFIRLKKPAEFRLIGKSLPRLDTVAKIKGQAVFGIDVQLPDLRVATLLQAPQIGSRATKIVPSDFIKDKKLEIVEIEDGVAVVGRNYWEASRGAQSLKISWSQPKTSVNSQAIFAHWKTLFDSPTAIAAKLKGKNKEALKTATTSLQAYYQFPFQAHATLEPQNCTAWVQKHRCDVWAPTQFQSGAHEAAIQNSGLPFDKVYIHTTYLGGGFGRRGVVDYVSQAVAISKKTGYPIKLIWSREEDTQHDFYRPASMHRLTAGFDKNNRVAAWYHEIIAPSIVQQFAPKMIGTLMPKWMPRAVKKVSGGVVKGASQLVVDFTSVEGAVEIPYQIKNIQVDYIKDDPGVRLGFWRSVGHSFNAFAVESFMDELAHATKEDPYAMRKRLLQGNDRMLRVLERVAKISAWESPLPPNQYKGIAIHASFKSVVAYVVIVTKLSDKKVKLEKVYGVVDCGLAVNPSIVISQIEGSIAFGISGMKSEITFKDSAVEQNNFNSFYVMRMPEMPQTQIEIMPSHLDPTGIGEPGVPPIGPAVANAIFHATGYRIRTLPVKEIEIT